MKPTKFYSSKQEKMIADYLGWSVVAASGARMFNPGDVISDMYLCECKTHTEKKDHIVIKKQVWAKITEEATSVLKRPVLFVDNGTQTVENTWCVVPQRFFTIRFLNHRTINMKESNTKFSILCSDLDKLKVYDCCVFKINNESLLLTSLETFKAMCFET